MQLGLVTYMWGATWDLPTVIQNCEETGFEGVELRTEHAHGVELSLNEQQRSEVKARFDDSAVRLVGLGTTCEFHSPNAGELRKHIEEAKQWAVLAHDVGATGIKVRPNGLPTGVPVPKTLEQIGKAMREVAEFAAGYGVEIRLEVHGGGTKIPANVKTIMDVANHPGAVVCWNCNKEDLDEPGLEANFAMLADRMGTIHIHDLISDYPWGRLFGLLRGIEFEGWTLLEEGAQTADPIRVMKYYRLLWEDLARPGG